MENSDKAALRDEVEPFYFGREPKRLYGCHHLPQVLSDREFAVVLCSPIGQEYLKSHRVTYQLAMLMAEVGFHVLRFDYFGCGDSAGDFEQGSIKQWKRDLLTAIDEIQLRSGMTKVCMIGMRIGAELALQAAAGRFDIVGLVFWEPVFNGEAYVKQLQDLHQEFISQLRYRDNSVTNRSKGESSSEVLGYPMTSALREELKLINPGYPEIRPGVKLLALLNSDESIDVSDRYNFAERYPQADLQTIVEKSFLWKEFNKRISPIKSLKYIVNWVGSLTI